MKKATVVKSFLGVMLFTLCVVTGLVAQTLTDSPQRKEQKRSELSGAPGMEVIESIVEYKPGETIDLHFHHGIEAVYVIQGTTVQAAGQAPVTMPSGLTQMNLRDVKHGGAKVVGETPLKLFTVHIVDKDKPLYEFVK